MKSKWRRYEVLLPARTNDGETVPDEVLGEAVKEILREFGAVSAVPNSVKGYWQHGETLYRDDLGLLYIDVVDTTANRKWMKAFKARWKERLEQLEIWVVSYRIDIE